MLAVAGLSQAVEVQPSQAGSLIQQQQRWPPKSKMADISLGESML